MIKIAHIEEVSGIKLPQEVVDVIMAAVTTLDEAYGHDRDVDGGDGGYVLIIKTKDELVKLKDIHIDVKTAMPEYMDRIQCNDGHIFISTLVLLNDDFGVVIVMPMELLVYTNWKTNLKEVLI